MIKTFANGGDLLPSDLNSIQDDLGLAIERSLSSVADIKLSAASATPYGWLVCDGSQVSRSTYSALFTAIGVSFGAGNGTTTFNVPDLRDRVPVGASATIALASTGGEKTHVLTVAELAAHTHDPPVGDHYLTDGTGTHYAYASATPSADLIIMDPPSTGSGTAHNNMQPYVGLKYLIKI